jgi:hypothetical protein
MPPKKRQKLKVKRKANKIVGDTSRVITRLHIPDERYRINKIIQRIMSMPDNSGQKFNGANNGRFFRTARRHRAHF